MCVCAGCTFENIIEGATYEEEEEAENNDFPFHIFINISLKPFLYL
jgi:hypothetical protein